MTDDLAREVPEEVAELFLDYKVGIQCRDECIKSFFGAGRAIKYGKDAQKAIDKAWALLRELWPDWKEKDMTYNYESKSVTLRVSAEDASSCV